MRSIRLYVEDLLNKGIKVLTIARIIKCEFLLAKLLKKKISNPTLLTRTGYENQGIKFVWPNSHKIAKVN